MYCQLMQNKLTVGGNQINHGKNTTKDEEKNFFIFVINTHFTNRKRRRSKSICDVHQQYPPNSCVAVEQNKTLIRLY